MKKPGLSQGRTGPRKSLNYFEEVIGAGADAGEEVGQQEAARKETAAAAIRNLTVFMMLLRLLVSIHEDG